MKNKTNTTIAIIGSSVAFSLVASLALADSVDSSGTAQAMVSVPVTISSTTTMATTTMTTSVTATGAMGSTSSANANGGITVTGSATGGTDVLDISASDANSGDVSASISSPMQVSTSDDLNVYAKTLVRGDASIKSAYASDNQVSITYKRPAKLFGFIPVTISEKAEVDVDAQNGATASVHKSWWGFLATDANYDSFQTELNAQVKGAPSVSANAALSASEKAMILSQIEAAAQATASANA